MILLTDKVAIAGYVFRYSLIETFLIEISIKLVSAAKLGKTI